ncbi:MAG: BolA/IbaG family iron-sulfur metabolism protein [Acidobacteria bacterium]|nr:BolA/IbaG family iron-sulfur metabolism protein [Acidobacteriota bacterium]
MQVQQSIERKLREALQPEHLEVANESHGHAGPGAETHFRVVVVSAAFDGKTRVAQHQLIYQTLEQERAEGVHALGIQTFTPEQFAAEQAGRVASPPCIGADAKDGPA